jgi:hypothetical protein
MIEPPSGKESFAFPHEPLPMGRGWTVALVVMAEGIVYLAALLTSMTRWMKFWLRGSYYLSYQVLYCTFLILFLCG